MLGHKNEAELFGYFKETTKEKGLSQQEPADKVYVTKATVSRWESGNRHLTAMSF